VPDGWKVIQDAKAACQIAVPPEWVPLGENAGTAVLHDSTTAIAVVTSQPGQEFKPLNAMTVKAMGIPKEKLFENSATRIFFQARTSRNPEEANNFNSSVPAKGGMCSCHVSVLPSVPEDVAKKIVLSLSPVQNRT
jgi:hypothetical protein